MLKRCVKNSEILDFFNKNTLKNLINTQTNKVINNLAHFFINTVSISYLVIYFRCYFIIT